MKLDILHNEATGKYDIIQRFEGTGIALLVGQFRTPRAANIRYWQLFHIHQSDNWVPPLSEDGPKQLEAGDRTLDLNEAGSNHLDEEGKPWPKDLGNNDEE
jgi:hypothetical protein